MGFLAARMGWLDPHRMLQYAADLRAEHGTRGTMMAFVAIVTLIVAVGLPMTPAALAGGALFGPRSGVVLGWIACVAGAAAGYWIARVASRGWIRRTLERYPALSKLEDANPFAVVLRLRLVPVIPLGLVSFASGLARLDFRAYLVATAIGILPTLAMFAYLADKFLSHMESARHAALAQALELGFALLAISLLPTAITAIQRRVSR